MHDLCIRKSIDFVIVLIPTKESVFAEYIESNKELRNSDVINQALTNERQVSRLVKEYFDLYEIPYIDVLPDLQRALPKINPYPTGLDGHPNADGNEIIAKAVQNGLGNLKQRRKNSEISS